MARLELDAEAVFQYSIEINSIVSGMAIVVLMNTFQYSIEINMAEEWLRAMRYPNNVIFQYSIEINICT